MSPTRRDLISTLFAGVAVAALPMEAVAAALPATTDENAHPRWNTPELIPCDEDQRPDIPKSWSADGWLFVDAKDVPGGERHTQRRMHIQGYVDGSIRIAFFPTSSFEQLNIGRGMTAFHIAPDLANEVWRGLFARDEDDTIPTEPWDTTPWDRDGYRQRQRTIRRRDAWAEWDRALEGDDGSTHNWFKQGAMA